MIARDLRFREDDDIDTVLVAAGAARAVLHVVVSAILYSTSANVRWPVAPCEMGIRPGRKNTSSSPSSRAR